MTAAKLRAATGPGFFVTSGCGRRWFVPREAVRRDYAKFLVKTNGLTRAQALAQVDASGPGAIDAWFAEQFVWADIEHYGVLVRERTEREAKALLKWAVNSARGSINDLPEHWKQGHRRG